MEEILKTRVRLFSINVSLISDQYNIFNSPVPLPLPKPPKNHRPVQSLDVEKSPLDRDSGMWSGSLSGDVTDWTKHNTTGSLMILKYFLTTSIIVRVAS